MQDNKNKRKIDSIKDFFRKNIKMKGLVLYIILNIIYILISSYLVTIKQISYAKMSKGFIPLLIVNAIIGVLIVIKGYYKKILFIFIYYY